MRSCRHLWVLALLGACQTSADSGDPADPTPPFTLVVYPDTQYLSLDYPAGFDAMTAWTAQVADERAVVMALHEGDITHRNTEAEWVAASHSLGLLEGEVPFALCLGNHDMTSGDTTLANEHFPPSRLTEAGGLAGQYAPARIDNAWYTFEAGATGWMVISLVYDPPDAVLEWADSVVADHPDRRVVVLTHAYLTPGGTRSGIGERIWDGLVRRHAGMTLVLNGHYTTGGEAARLVSTNDQGTDVVQLFANYQTRPGGGAGLLRIVRVDPDAAELQVSTYSPWLEFWEVDDENQFTVAGVELGPP